MKIERERRRIYDLAQREPHNNEKLLQVSWRLDELINKYQQEIKAFL